MRGLESTRSFANWSSSLSRLRIDCSIWLFSTGSWVCINRCRSSRAESSSFCRLAAEPSCISCVHFCIFSRLTAEPRVCSSADRRKSSFSLSLASCRHFSPNCFCWAARALAFAVFSSGFILFSDAFSPSIACLTSSEASPSSGSSAVLSCAFRAAVASRLSARACFLSVSFWAAATSPNGSNCGKYPTAKAAANSPPAKRASGFSNAKGTTLTDGMRGAVSSADCATRGWYSPAARSSRAAVRNRSFVPPYWSTARAASSVVGRL